MFTDAQIADFQAVLSAPRFATYLHATHEDRQKAIELYLWNTNVSCAFYFEIQFCELAVRNAAVEAIEIEFGQNWHLNKGFLYSLPVPRKGRGYQPRNDLTFCARTQPTAGKVVAELKLAFWQNLFIVGQDKRLWEPHLAQIFPHYDTSLSIAQARSEIYTNIHQIRILRNRIAHHEPIFKRDLAMDLQRIRSLIFWRRASTKDWIEEYGTASAWLQNRPT